MTSKTLPQPAKPTKEVRGYVAAFNKGGRLVMPNGSGWRVVRPDGRSIAKATKKEAIAKAEKDLAGSQSKVFVFNGQGEVVDSYVPQS